MLFLVAINSTDNYNHGQKFVERLNVCASFALNLFLLHFISMATLPIQCCFGHNGHNIVVSDLEIWGRRGGGGWGGGSDIYHLCMFSKLEEKCGSKFIVTCAQFAHLK